MEIKNTYLYSLILIAGLVVSCSLDPTAVNSFEDEATWSFPDYAEGVLMNAYANVPQRFSNYNNNFLDVVTDNAVTNTFGTNIYEVAIGGISPNYNPVGEWNTAYDQFRNIHLFLENGLSEKSLIILPIRLLMKNTEAGLRGSHVS